MTQKYVNATFSDTPVRGVSRAGRQPRPGAVDIQMCTHVMGLLAYDPGFRSTASCKSAITFVDGAKRVLLYRGYPIGGGWRSIRALSRWRTCSCTVICRIPASSRTSGFNPAL